MARKTYYPLSMSGCVYLPCRTFGECLSLPVTLRNYHTFCILPSLSRTATALTDTLTNTHTQHCSYPWAKNTDSFTLILRYAADTISPTHPHSYHHKLQILLLLHVDIAITCYRMHKRILKNSWGIYTPKTGNTRDITVLNASIL